MSPPHENVGVFKDFFGQLAAVVVGTVHDHGDFVAVAGNEKAQTLVHTLGISEFALGAVHTGVMLGKYRDFHC